MNNIDPDNNDFEDEPGKSKTQIKNEMQALQDLGVALTKLSNEKLATIPMSDKLRDTILEAPTIKKHSSIRRHMQFIGKLMRMDDHESILAAYEKLQSTERNIARQGKLVEQWRDRLIAGEKDALNEFLKSYPSADRQQLNQLIRNSQKEISHQKNLGSRKKLFRFISALSQNS